MSASSARSIEFDENKQPEPRRERHLRLVSDEIVRDTAATFGTDRENVLVALSLLAFALAGEATTGEAGVDVDAWRGFSGDEDAVDYDEVLRVSDGLASTFRIVSEQLRAEQGVTIPSSEVRTRWAEVLERVRTGGELLYITHHGERAAALVPPYVADFYRDAEDKADASAIDQATADREAGDEPVPLDDLLSELGL